MKIRYLFLFLILSYTGNLFSQTRGINYKALISDNIGTPLANQSVTVQFTILEGNMATNEVYKETHATTTDSNGIIIVNIGEGTNLSGDFQTINWGFDTHFVKTEIDTGSGFIDFGTTEFKTVPYALYAENTGGSGNVSPFTESTPNRITATNTNANFVVGSPSLEDQNNVNLDSRMFFDKSKVAFRAGAVDGVQWNNSNRGLYSFAAGRNNTANGLAATAFGTNNQVAGSSALALGSQNTVNGSNSLVAGFGNISSNQINAQTVLGKWNEVETDALLIIGNGADDATRKNVLSVKSDGNIIANDLDVIEITQPNALATKAYVDANAGTISTGLEQLDEGNGNGWRLIGQDSNNFGNIGLNAVDLSTATFPSTTYGATGSYAFSAGIVTTASGFGATALGNGSSATADNAFAAGGASTASGESSVALGRGTIASGDYSFAVGENSQATDEYANAFGNNSVASGFSSFAVGGSTASGTYSVAFGGSTASGNTSFSAGANNFAGGQTSVALGRFTRVTNDSATAIGLFNEDDTNALFMIGNGTGVTARNNAFSVMESGVVNIDNLAGTGTRTVSVTANGNLVANSTPDSDILVITPFDFNKEDVGGSGITMTRHRIDGAYISVPGDVSEIYAPIQFPKNAVIRTVEFIYKDSNTFSGRALEFTIGFQQFNASNNSTQSFFVAGTQLNTNSYSPANRIATANNVNFPISGFNSSTYRAYYVRIKPVSGGSWSGTSDTAIQQVRIHYTY
ncbi:hypothetical protein [Kordia sp.]|uniref:hypothetical protein n=1 Tax=Kordia sp. TaxID=1965332 RepID=UPI003B5B410D